MSSSLLCASNKFVHLVYEYRYLALAGRAWTQFGPKGTDQEKKEAANKLVPGINVLFQDSLLMHARLLIDFYTKRRADRGKPTTDILLEDFNLPAVSDELRENLNKFKEPIEVHVLHLTIWRDTDYRTANSTTPYEKKRQRIDWNHDIPIIIGLLLDALDKVSEATASSLNEDSKTTASWKKAFHHLHCKAKSILDDASGDFPPELLEKEAIIDYLRKLGLD